MDRRRKSTSPSRPRRYLLEDGQPHLDFSFDSMTAMPEQRLEVELSYGVTALEHEISEATRSSGLQGIILADFHQPAGVHPRGRADSCKDSDPDSRLSDPADYGQSERDAGE